MLAGQEHKGNQPANVAGSRSATGFRLTSNFRCYSTEQIECVEWGASSPQTLHRKAYSVFLNKSASNSQKTTSTCSK